MSRGRVQPPRYRGRAPVNGPWWRCHVTPCPTTEGERQHAKSYDAATRQAHAHYMTHHLPPILEERKP